MGDRCRRVLDSLPCCSSCRLPRRLDPVRRCSSRKRRGVDIREKRQRQHRRDERRARARRRRRRRRRAPRRAKGALPVALARHHGGVPTMVGWARDPRALLLAVARGKRRQGRRDRVRRVPRALAALARRRGRRVRRRSLAIRACRRSARSPASPRSPASRCIAAIRGITRARAARRSACSSTRTAANLAKLVTTKSSSCSSVLRGDALLEQRASGSVDAAAAPKSSPTSPPAARSANRRSARRGCGTSSSGVVHDAVAPHEHVEIDRARPPALLAAAVAAEQRSSLEHRRDQLAGRRVRQRDARPRC